MCRHGLCPGGWFVSVYRNGLYPSVEVVCTCVEVVCTRVDMVCTYGVEVVCTYVCRWFVPMCENGLYLCVEVVYMMVCVQRWFIKRCDCLYA